MLLQTLAMPTIVILVIFIFTLYVAVLHRKQHRNHGKNAPGPKALPIIGNLHMLGKLPHRTLQSLAKEYGPIMSFKLGQVPAIVISSPETAELFLKTHDTLFASRPRTEASKFLLKNKGLVFSEYGAYWRNMRKLCTLQLLSASKVEMFAPLRREGVGTLVKRIKNAAALCEAVDLSELVGELMENIVYKMVLGRTKDDRFDLKGLVEEVLSLVGAFNVADFIPWLGVFDPQGLTRRLKRASKAFDKVLEQIIEDHEHAPDDEQKGPRKKDFVDILLSLMHQPMDLNDGQKYVIDKTNIKAIIIEMIGASLDTSITTVEWAMSELLRNPSVMKRLQDQLEHVVGMNRQVEESDIEKLPYLNMVVKETWRLYPTAPLLVPRESREDVTIEGYCIKKKSRIIVNAWAIGRDPKVWSHNAEMFDPERFADSNVDIRGNDFRVLPFGSGRRGCAGIHMGLTTVKFVLAQLLHCFNWVLPLGTSPDNLDMNEKFGLTMPRSKHLLALPTYRLVG